VLMARTFLKDVYATIVREPLTFDGADTLHVVGIPYSRRAFQTTDLIALVDEPSRPI